jgi:hypothetical protein
LLYSPTHTSLVTSHAFMLILFHLDFDQVITMQALCRSCYHLTIPRFMRRTELVVRPDFVFFDFSSIKQQQRVWLKEKYSSEAKSSDDEFGRLLYARVWYFNMATVKQGSSDYNPWTFQQIRISPSMMTKGGYRTVVTQNRFRAFLIGGNNSRQVWEYQLDRKKFRSRANMVLKRAYFAHAVKDERDIYVVGGRGDLNAKLHY